MNFSGGLINRGGVVVAAFAEMLPKARELRLEIFEGHELTVQDCRLYYTYP